MNSRAVFGRKSMIAGAVAVLLAAPLATSKISGGIASAGLIGEAQAAQGAGQQSGQGAGMGGQGGGGQGQMGGGGGAGTQGGQGGKKGISKVLEADDDSDSDRPSWAGGDKEENPHRGEGNPQPGDMKGDEYGDLWVFVRDPSTGLPVTVTCDAGTCYQVVVCADAECTTTETFELSTDPEAELPEGVAPLEVDLGRLNLGRAPTTVVEHAEDEAMSKITVDGATLTLDPAGRIVVDGVTIDSPLENLALYIAIMTGDTQVLAALEPLLPDDSATFELAASLLGASADKTGEITPDVVFYSNIIYGLVPGGADYVDYTALDYDRAATYKDTTVTYQELNADGTTTPVTGTIYDLVFAGVPLTDNNGGIDAFTAASNDALQVIEFIHEPIHDLQQ